MDTSVTYPYGRMNIIRFADNSRRFCVEWSNRRRDTTVLCPCYDYTQSNAYFITICTHQREHFFGEIINHQMELSLIGEYADTFWKSIPEHFGFVYLDRHVLMPNHVHGIVIITHNSDSTYQPEAFGKPRVNSIPTIVRAYKGQVTYQARQTSPELGTLWQGSYHEYIIRDGNEYRRIRDYILHNPHHWAEDKFFKSL
jgi:putative transposase